MLSALLLPTLVSGYYGYGYYYYGGEDQEYDSSSSELGLAGGLSFGFLILGLICLILGIRRHLRLEELRELRDTDRKVQRLPDLCECCSEEEYRKTGLLQDSPFDGPSVVGRGSEALCSICLSDFEEGDRVWRVKACQHEYHQSCLEDWYASQVEAGKEFLLCPLCRAPMEKPSPPVDVHTEQEQVKRMERHPRRTVESTLSSLGP